MVKTVDVLGVPHAYELTAPTRSDIVLVFVHGWLLSREYWQPIIQRLSTEYQCLSYDLRGFGGSQPQHHIKTFAVANRSYSTREMATERVEFAEVTVTECPVSSYSPSAYAKDLGILLKQLNISSAWLVGHSLGGSIALWAASQFPESVKGVVCINSGGGIYLKEEFERFRAAGQQLVKLRPQWLRLLPLIDLPMTRMNVARPIARRWGKQRVLDWVAAHPDAALGTLMDSTTEAEVHHLPQIVSKLKQPVYFIAGENDTIMEPKYVHHLASFHRLFRCCGDNVVEIPNCGHLSMVEQPDAVADEVKTILAKHGVESPTS
ncbi:alpha/beta hydrolase [Oculatella sp. LEGE 06141]|uniref:alpha/beta fold hydrolase n=1 Tax=Oculatella sp. LEGE 06141 TaxID=1828648 RepID=UPI0018810BE2|nr:alpha/beta hydrolase [Oculatella sp. LEGE 06141]MBE9180476.1 alpha/beta hydrolase [Oculatella sp. LEGE 06141]